MKGRTLQSSSVSFLPFIWQVAVYSSVIFQVLGTLVSSLRCRSVSSVPLRVYLFVHPSTHPPIQKHTLWSAYPVSGSGPYPPGTKASVPELEWRGQCGLGLAGTRFLMESEAEFLKRGNTSLANEFLWKTKVLSGPLLFTGSLFSGSCLHPGQEVHRQENKFTFPITHPF